jgi:hypothetical protein
MTIRFSRSLRIVPGVRLNFGLHGVGFSIGRRGLHIGMNRFGAYTSVGIPEMRLYAVHHFRTDDGEHHVRGSIDIIGILAIIALAVTYYVLASIGFGVIERAWRQ